MSLPTHGKAASKQKNKLLRLKKQKSLLHLNNPASSLRHTVTATRRYPYVVEAVMFFYFLKKSCTFSF